MKFEGNKTQGSLQENTDAEVFLALKAGQPQALAILYDRHVGLVYGIAYKVLGNAAEAEDLTQDIFLNLTHSSFDPQRGSLRTYLGILVRSRCLDRLRSWRNRQRSLERGKVELQAQGSFSRDPSLEQLSQTERLEEVQTALAELSESQRQILKMAYYEGMSQSEIAKQLNLPLGTVKARARRGLLRLRQRLDPKMGGPS
ncbi:sigma-70 family RNA polymerase sigma factor [Synechococcus sp. Nb3U1]|uniref:sigma-70 family RNA polymerase sigma factor n=1 Tax=Synechococcus sp. Nb3U1 TaxID=1914529 RepID=UPI001F3B8CA7|nr:sigma-70 family RNA polymerase sigma factor [Synechococcus sp. Nb3U1]MCF2970899.1 sigma-70 family RNA polymerase sigma factor [Synechococcus sp. Nb3U1]